MGLNPSRAEVEILPGTEKTLAFEIESPPSNSPVRGRLLLSSTDWTISEDGAVQFPDPGTLPDSASRWIVFSPSAVSISSGQKQMVRVTVSVPEKTSPGSYRTAIFVQERPPATPPEKGEHKIYLRFRYVYTLYVIVPPATGEGAVQDVRVAGNPKGLALVFDWKNSGNRHVRPVVTWSLQNAAKTVVASTKRYDATVVLPHMTMHESFPLPDGLEPGTYEVTAHVDFQTGQPVEEIKRIVEITAVAKPEVPKQ